MHQSKLDIGKALHRYAQLCLYILTSANKLVECKYSLRLRLDDLLHAVEVVVNTLHYHLFVALNIKVHDLKFRWEARLDPIGDVLEIGHKLFTNFEHLLQFLLINTIEIHAFECLHNSVLNSFAHSISAEV